VFCAQLRRRRRRLLLSRKTRAFIKRVVCSCDAFDALNVSLETAQPRRQNVRARAKEEHRLNF